MKITVVKKASGGRKPRMECPWWVDDIIIESPKK